LQRLLVLGPSHNGGTSPRLARGYKEMSSGLGHYDGGVENGLAGRQQEAVLPVRRIVFAGAGEPGLEKVALNKRSDQAVEASEGKKMAKAQSTSNLDTAVTKPSADSSIAEYLRERLMPVEGVIPHIPGIEMFGNSIPAGAVGGDLYEYINFE